MAIWIFVATVAPFVAMVLFVAHNSRVSKAIKAGEPIENKGWGPPVDKLHLVLRVLVVIGLMAGMALTSSRDTFEFYPTQGLVLAGLSASGCLSLLVIRLRYGIWN